MKTTINVRRVAKDSIRMYFAPLTGAFKGIRDEVRRNDRDIAKRTNEDKKFKAATHA